MNLSKYEAMALLRIICQKQTEDLESNVFFNDEGKEYRQEYVCLEYIKVKLRKYIKEEFGCNC